MLVQRFIHSQKLWICDHCHNEDDKKCDYDEKSESDEDTDEDDDEDDDKGVPTIKMIMMRMRMMMWMIVREGKGECNNCNIATKLYLFLLCKSTMHKAHNENW